jgi:hypothetical protein
MTPLLESLAATLAVYVAWAVLIPVIEWWGRRPGKLIEEWRRGRD